MAKKDRGRPPTTTVTLESLGNLKRDLQAVIENVDSVCLGLQTIGIKSIQANFQPSDGTVIIQAHLRDCFSKLADAAPPGMPQAWDPMYRATLTTKPLPKTKT